MGANCQGARNANDILIANAGIGPTRDAAENLATYFLQHVGTPGNQTKFRAAAANRKTNRQSDVSPLASLATRRLRFPASRFCCNLASFAKFTNSRINGRYIECGKRYAGYADIGFS